MQAHFTVYIAYCLYTSEICTLDKMEAVTCNRQMLRQLAACPEQAWKQFRACNSPAQHGVQLLSLHETNVRAHFTVYIACCLYTSEICTLHKMEAVTCNTQMLRQLAACPEQAWKQFRACNSPAQHGVQLLSLHETNVRAHFTVYIACCLYTSEICTLDNMEAVTCNRQMSRQQRDSTA